MNTEFSDLPTGKKIFFASDFHLGTKPEDESLQREKKIIRWLETIEKEAAAIFLVGDIFDFWFEYKRTIPKGFIRLQGKFADLTDKGIPLVFFTGNHDMWMFDYFTTELGIPIYRTPEIFDIGGRIFLIGHGDGLGPGDGFYKLLKKVFSNRIAQWIFKWTHPDIGMKIAHAWSQHSRISHNEAAHQFKGEDEWLWKYCQKIEVIEHHDYYVFGHRHLPLELKVGEKSQYINLGEWVNYSKYGVFDGQTMKLKDFEG